MPEAGSRLLAPASERSTQLLAWSVAVALPALGLVLLLATPAADVRWEHHPSHFWLVLAAAVVSAALAFQTSGIAVRRADARLLISLAFLSAAGFLALHALATPGVLLDTPNQGFVLATPVGLLIAALFAGLSALRLPPERAAAIIRHARVIRAGLLVVMVAWAALPGVDSAARRPDPGRAGHGRAHHSRGRRPGLLRLCGWPLPGDGRTRPIGDPVGRGQRLHPAGGGDCGPWPSRAAGS